MIVSEKHRLNLWFHRGDSVEESLYDFRRPKRTSADAFCELSRTLVMNGEIFAT
jgi:hypothetical protein